MEKAKIYDVVRKGVLAKVLFYLSLIPRLVRLYRSDDHAKNLIWHAKDRVKDGKLRHPADSPA